MFGPSLPIHVRGRIYRRRLAGAYVAAAILLGAALAFIHYEPHPYTPPEHAGYLGPPLIVTQIDEIREEVSERDLLAGGHPLPQTLEAVEVELELTHEAEDLLVEEKPGDSEEELPEIEEPRPGPRDLDAAADRDAAPLSIQSEDIVVLKFVKPPYPSDARLLGSEGVVTVTAAVGADGTVKSVVARTTGNVLPSCVAAARLATMKWRFAPRMLGSTPQPFEVRIPFRFSLDGGVQTGT